MKSAGTIIMWAVICKSVRSEWIHWHTLATTKRDAWKKYCALWTEDKYAIAEMERKMVRLAKVAIQEFNP